MSLLTAFLVILTLGLAGGSVAAGLGFLSRRQRKRLGAPLITSVCPECEIPFGQFVVENIKAIDISRLPPAESQKMGRAQKITVISFGCPCCKTVWKYCDGTLVKAAESEVHRHPPRAFPWLIPWFKDTILYSVIWHVMWWVVWWAKRKAIRVRQNIREEICLFWQHKDFALCLSWICGLVLWWLLTPNCLGLFTEESYGQRAEVGFALMILGLASGSIACFRCPEKRFAGLALAINSLPVVYLIGILLAMIQCRAWQIQIQPEGGCY